MNINNSFPSKYLKSGDIDDQDLILTIRNVTVEDIGQGESKEHKPVVYFHEIEKGMVLNKTNATTISSMYGPETDNWPGKKISVFATEVDFQGKQTLSLRVRTRSPQVQPVTVGGNGNSAASGEQWEQFYTLASQFEAIGSDIPEPPDTIGGAEMTKLLAKYKAKLTAAPERKSYPGVWVKELIASKYAENAFDATGMLNKSNLDETTSTLEQVVAWAKNYRAWRDGGKTPDEAAALANDGKTPA
jgi:hypothetical protein